MIDKAAARNVLNTVIETLREDYVKVDLELTKYRVDSRYVPEYSKEEYNNYKLYKHLFVED